jgi:large subunit ribosomal protein L9
MKVILTTNVDAVGREGEIKEVKSGLARNYLLPKKLAVIATPANMKIWEQKSGAIQKRDDQAKGEAETLSQRIDGVTVSITVKVGEEEKLFGSVTSQNIADALSGVGFDIDKKHIELESPIKSLGSHEVKIKLHQDVTPNITVEVVSEDNPAGESEEEEKEEKE